MKSNVRSLSVLLVLSALLVIAPQAGFAQVNAVVGGTVEDPSGAVIPGAAVVATNINTGIVTNAEANATGNYQFPSLQPGPYRISASYSGFQTQTFNNVQLGQGDSIRLNFALQLAAAAQTVEVVADAATLLTETSASIENTLQERTVLNLPVSTRNVFDMIQTTPGVVALNGIFGANVNFSGTATGAVNTTRDGLITNDGRYNAFNGAYSSVFTSPDMVEEVEISTNSIDPSRGRGSGQVSLRTRGGTNQFHGALFYTNNNSALSSRDWFAALRGAQRSYFNRNQYGGRLGGPIWKNKAFFFVLVDNQRYLDKQLVTSTVLTEQARNGVFRFLTTGGVGGTSRRNGNAFATTPSVDLAGNVLTSDGGEQLFLNSFNVFTDVRDPNYSSIDQLWVQSQYLKRMPLPNDYSVGDGLNTAGFRWLRRQNGTDGATGSSPNPNRDHLTTRFDYQINDSHRVTYTMTREKDSGVTGQTGLPAFPNGYAGDVQRRPDFYTAAWSAVISPTFLNEFRFGLKRDTWQGTSPFDKGCCFGAGQNDVVDSAAEARSSFPQTDGSFVYVDFTGAGGLGTGDYAPFGVASPRASVSPLKQFADTVSINKGAHSMQAGVEFNFFNSKQSNHGGQQTTRPFVTLGQGNVPVQGVTTAAFPGLNTNDVGTAQNLLASLAGSIVNVQEQFFVNSPTQDGWSDYRDGFLFNRNIHQNDWALFFKDTWKVSANLTLNFGLRYDKYGTPYDSYGLGGRFTGGQSGLFGISGTSFANAQWAPGVANGSITTTEFVGKNSPQPDKLIFNNDWNNFAPSLGFSYNVPWFDKTTIIRGGYGINYSGAPNFLGYSGNIGNLPGQTLNVTYSPSDYLDLAGLLNANLLPVDTGGAEPFAAIPVDSPTGRSANITGYTDDHKVPYIQSFNLAVQRELASNLTLEVSWVGNKATKLWGNTQINEANIFENGILDAFNVTRAGGNAPLFTQMLMGLNVPGAGVVDGVNLTGSQALRLWTSTNQLIANGEAADLADFLNRTSSLTGANGGILRNGNLPENFIVVNPQFNSVNLEGNNANSTYHSFQATVNQRYRAGFSWQFSYVFSKTLGILGQRDPRSRNLDKGLSSNHRAHLVKLNGVWDLPFGTNGWIGRGMPAWADHIAGGWTVSPVINWVSGAPLTFTTGRDTRGALATNATADLVGSFDPGSVVVGDGVVDYFSGLSVQRAATPDFGGDATLPRRFTNNVVVDQSGNVVLQNALPGTPGTSAQNLPTLEGPAALTFNTSLSKRVNIGETMYFTLRADAINLLNKPIWGNPNTNINSNSFGRITSATGSRTVTLNLRFDF